MAYLYDLPTNTTNFDQIVVQLIAEVPLFTPMLLFFVYFVVTLGGIGQQTLRTGTADYAMWSVVGSLAMFVVALVMSITAGFIQLDWLVIVTVITIFSGVWFFFSKKGGEI